MMPDYTMLYYTDVKYELILGGYDVSIVMVDSTGFDYGTVVDTQPVAGSFLETGQEIRVFVSKGTEITFIQMPKLIGYDSKKAMDLIIANHLRVGTVTYIESDEYAPGTILSQSITPQSYIPILNKVDLIIAK